MQKILVIASHPDDEILGAGATFHKHVLSGDEVYCLILGHGLDARSKIIQNELNELSLYATNGNIHGLEKEVREAAGIIGFKENIVLSNRDNMFDTIPLLSIIKDIERHIERWQPLIIYTHNGGDLNIDHQRTFQAVMTACRPGCTSVKEIYCFETPSSSEWGTESFKPNTFVEISHHDLETKIKALECYTSEIRPYPHPRSQAGLRAHAEFYGTMAGVKLAEAFELVRCIR